MTPGTDSKDHSFDSSNEAALRRKMEVLELEKAEMAARLKELEGERFMVRLYEELGFRHLPICMAKTQYSLSHDPALKGRPRGFRLPIREVRLAAGAGFITPLAGEMRTMPGLPSRPGGENIDIDADGNVVGLF